jgi:hypothetical protein
MKKTLFVIILTIFSLYGQKPDSLKQNIILEKKYTIPITERLQIRSVKKTGTLKIIHLRPEVNPILYNKEMFYQKLQIKKRKSFREIFNYPLLTASLAGGTSGWLSSALGFQINGGKIIPSMYWSYSRFDNDWDNQFRRMLFQGGFRYHISKDVSLKISAGYEDGKSDFIVPVGIIFEWDSTAISGSRLNTSYSLFQPLLSLSIQNQNLTAELETGYMDFQQKIGVKNQMQDNFLRYNMVIPFNGWYVWSTGNMHSVLSQIRETDSTIADGAYLQLEGGVGVQWKQVDLRLGGGYINQENILPQDPDRNIIYTADLSAGIIPDYLFMNAYYRSGFERVDLLDNIARYNVMDFYIQGPNLIRDQYGFSLQWTPMDSMSVDMGWTKKTYSDLHLLQVVRTDSTNRLLYSLSLNNYSMGIWHIDWNYNFKTIYISGSFSWLNWKPVGALTHLPLFPEKTIDLLIRYQNAKWQIESTVHFEGDRWMPLNNLSVESFTDLGIQIQYRIQNHFQISLVAQNLLNQDIETIPLIYYKSRIIGLQTKVQF